MSLQDIFLQPLWGLFLLVLPLLWYLLRRCDKNRVRRLADSIGTRTKDLVTDFEPRRRRERRRMTIAGLFFTGVALMQPTWGEANEGVSSRGVDIVICLDTSRSMLARDHSPNRIERAREDIARLVRSLKGDRIALVAFAGEARLISPLTQDRESFLALLDDVDFTSVAQGGTDIGAAIDRARNALQGATGDHECVVVLSDGEDQQDANLPSATTAEGHTIPVHGVGYGSALGSKIPVETEDGEVFLKDNEGREVVTALKPFVMQRMASLTKGSYLEATSRTTPLIDLLQDSIRPMASVTRSTGDSPTRQNRYQWPLLLAFLFFTLELAWGDRRIK